MNQSSDERAEISKRVFIIGCPRSGSTWLSLLLSKHPEVAVFQHSKLMQYLRSLYVWWLTKDLGFGKLIVSVSDQPDDLPPEELNVPIKYGTLLSEQECLSICRTTANKIFQAVASRKPNTKVVVDKTPESGHIAKFIHKVYPEAYFLHIVRDPRSVVSSLKHAGESWAKGEFPTNPIDASDYWNEQISTGLRIQERSPNYMQIRYEDLAEKGVGQLREVFEFLGLEVTDKFCSGALETCSISQFKKDRDMPQGFFRKGEADSWRRELSSRDIKLIEYVTARLMKELDYEPIMAPYRRAPFKLWWFRRASWCIKRFSIRLKRISNRLPAKWIGRSIHPEAEFTVY